MTCEEAGLAMLNSPEERRSGGGRSLARHLASCATCRETFEVLQYTAELLGAWSDLPVAEHEKSACVERLVAEVGSASARRSARAQSAFLPAGLRLAACMAVLGLVVFLFPIGGEVSSISAEVGEALASIEQWHAEGTATPPLLVGPDVGVCNHVEIWFRKPDRLRVRVDDGPDGPLFALDRAGGLTDVRDPYHLVGPGIATEAARLDMEKLFSVRDWFANRRLMDAPVRDLGLEQFGRRTARRIEIDPPRGWISEHPNGTKPTIELRVDSETMLPLLLETGTHGSVIVLDFEYGVPFPEG
jgi:hypothetical protein